MFLKLVVEKFPIVTNFHDVIKTVVSRPQIHCVFHNLLCLNYSQVVEGFTFL